ncbi:uncharacterized protein PgNI_02711 [Pyricularia grisea]|uniref:Uncharacterized protein n=1 Tax=Pyricularia grisea TaxID=148305 RepID=A0A6P8BCA9_PYRGI|nr:uncharacterized protein PgNI_02711 [Pyricularia grisea]TLD13433.1 hypothetical protein PgNI_02711 [Pyricularia grisea]
MRFIKAFPLAVSLFAPYTVAEMRLNVTAIGAQNGASTIECWEVDSPIDAEGNLNLGNSEGPYNIPYNLWLFLLKGMFYFTFSGNDSTDAYLTAGEFGLLFAADTADVSVTGHVSASLGNTETVFARMATEGGGLPNHRRVHMGACNAIEMAGWRKLGWNKDKTWRVAGQRLLDLVPQGVRVKFVSSYGPRIWPGQEFDYIVRFGRNSTLRVCHKAEFSRLK